MKYFFLLGINPKISVAEIRSRLNTIPEDLVQNYSIFETEEKLDQEFLNSLGGTQKIAKEISYPEILERAKNTDGKFIFGMSQFPEKTKLKTELIGLKKEIKKLGKNVRFVNKDFKNLSNEVFFRENLKEKGGEIILFKDKYFLVEAVQEISNYSKRDFGKPSRNMKRGILPPKLAQIMINLLGEAETIYDPFCGDGVILMEGALIQKQVFGSDINGRAVEDAKENLNWLSKEFNTKDFVENVFLHDAAQIPEKKLKIDGIVSEGFLGPPQSRFPDKTKANQIFSNIRTIHSKFIKSCKSYLEKDSSIVLTLPFFQKGEKKILLPGILEEFMRAGFKIFDFEKWDYSENINRGKSTLFYSRESQIVGREIVRITRA